MRFLSVCSGIEAASVAWEPLGWKALAFAEIEAFPRAVLAHHYPDTPLHGDFTLLRDQPWIVDADLLVGGTPCQAFSIAGLRQSLSDDRGNLSLEFVRLADAIDDLRRDAGREPAWILWENVPGVFSVDDNAFGAFLAGLVGSDEPITPRGRWTDAGVVSGPKRVAAWRVLDAQFFGLAQRRRRVFVLAREHPRGWECADALLPIIDSLSGHPAPRRKAGKDVAPTLSSRPSGGGGLGTDFDLDGGLVSGTLGTTSGDWSRDDIGESRGQDPVVAVEAYGGNNTSGPIDVATALSSHGGPHGRQDFESETFVAHALRGEGFEASEDGTGRGTPIIPVSYRTAGDGAVYDEGDLCAPLTTGSDPSANVIAFSSKDHGADAQADLAPTLRAGVHSGSHANAGVPPAIAYSIMPQNSGKDCKAREVDVAQPLMAAGPVGGDQGGDQGGATRENPASDSGTNRTPPVHINAGAVVFQPRHYSGRERMGGEPSDVCHTLSAQAGQGDSSPHVAYSIMPQNSGKDYKAREVDVAQPLMASGPVGGDQGGATRENPASGPDGVGVQADIAYTVEARAEVQAVAFALRGREGGAMPEVHDHVSALRAASGGSSRDFVAFDTTQVTSAANRSNPQPGDPCHPLAAGAHPPAIAGSAVRRLLPVECCRLQGFPDDYLSQVPWRGQAPPPDGPMYKALGNSMATNVMRYIGERIAAVEASSSEAAA